MQKIKCGIDIVEIERIEKSITRTNGKFIEEVYTQKEIEYCESKKNAKYQHYAVRFAAKEAIFKAISDFLTNKYEISWQNIQILNNEQGRPYIEFINTKLDQIKSIDISLSHCKQYAIANVALIYEE